MDKQLNYMIVDDFFKGKKHNQNTVRWHFNPDIDLKKVTQNKLIINCKGSIIGRVVIEPTQSVEIKVINTPFSKCYGQMSEKCTLEIDSKGKKENRIRTKFFFDTR